MFTKLLKHDLRATSRIIPFSFLALGVLYFVTYIIRLTVGEYYEIAYAIPLILFILADIAMYILTLVLVIVHYYRTMFGAPGYFTHTLPATKCAIFFSKYLTILIWFCLSSILFFAGIFGAIVIVDNNPLTLFRGICHILSLVPVSLVISFLGLILGQVLLFVSAVTGCMTLANIGAFSKNNVAFSFIFFIVFSIVQNIIDLLALLFIPFGLVYSPAGGSQIVFESMIFYNSSPDVLVQTGLGSIIVDLLMAAGFILLSIYLLKKRVPLK